MSTWKTKYYQNKKRGERENGREIGKKIDSGQESIEDWEIDSLSIGNSNQFNIDLCNYITIKKLITNAVSIKVVWRVSVQIIVFIPPRTVNSNINVMTIMTLISKGILQ